MRTVKQALEIDKAGEILSSINENYIITTNDKQDVTGIFIRLDCKIEADIRFCSKIQKSVNLHRKTFRLYS